MGNANDMQQALELIDRHLEVSQREKFQSIDQFGEFINRLLIHDFPRLLSILYRLDIDEKKAMEQVYSDDPGKIIAEMIIERQIEKIKSRRKFSRDDENIDEDERW